MRLQGLVWLTRSPEQVADVVVAHRKITLKLSHGRVVCHELLLDLQGRFIGLEGVVRLTRLAKQNADVVVAACQTILVLSRGGVLGHELLHDLQ